MRKLNTVVFLCALTLVLVASVAAADSVTPTDYYLPKGYKVHAQIWVPAAPFFPGLMLGGAVGIEGKYCTIYVQAYGWKNPWNWAQYKSAVRVVKVCGGQREVVADTQVVGNSYYVDVVITYSWNGYVTIAASTSKGGHLSSLYGFSASVPKYIIVSQGAKVDPPQPLPRPTTSNPAGSGYNPPTVKDIQTRYLLLGLGVGALAVGVLVAALVRRRGGKA